MKDEIEERTDTEPQTSKLQLGQDVSPFADVEIRREILLSFLEESAWHEPMKLRTDVSASISLSLSLSLLSNALSLSLSLPFSLVFLLSPSISLHLLLLDSLSADRTYPMVRSENTRLLVVSILTPSAPVVTRRT